MSGERKKARNDAKMAMLEAAREWWCAFAVKPDGFWPDKRDKALFVAINEFARQCMSYKSGEVPESGDEAVGEDGCVWHVDFIDAVTSPSHPLRCTCTGFAEHPDAMAYARSKEGDVKELKPSWLTKLDRKECGDCQCFQKCDPAVLGSFGPCAARTVGLDYLGQRAKGFFKGSVHSVVGIVDEHGEACSGFTRRPS